MQTKIIERYFFFALLFATFIFAFFIFQPFWVVLVLGISFSIVLHPVYEKLNKKMPKGLAAFLTVLFFTLIVGIPLFGVGVLIFNETGDAYHSITNNLLSSNFVDSINDSINKILPEDITFNLYDKISSFISLISSNLAKVFTSTLATIFSSVLTLLAMFYFLKDGARWKKALIALSPLGDKDDKKIIGKLEHAVNGIIKGYLLVALIQGILMGAGLAIFGVPNPALWGMITVITALVPTVGTAIISIPAVIFLFVTDNTAQAVGLLFWSLAIVGTIDNLLSPYIVGNKINLPSFLILFSVLGGISLLGPVGILVGPLTISLLYSLISLYRNEFNQDKIESSAINNS